MDERDWKRNTPKENKKLIALGKEAAKQKSLAVYTPKSKKPTKISEGKLFYEIDWEFIEGMAIRMAKNKQNGKYERFGWDKDGVDVVEMNQAITRHLIEIHKDNPHDDDQLFSHYYAIACNCMLIVNSLKKEKHD